MMNQNSLLICQYCKNNYSDVKICLNCTLTLCENCNYQYHKKLMDENHTQISLKKQIQKKTKNNLQVFLFCHEIQRNYFLNDKSNEQMIKRQIFQYITSETINGKGLVSFKKIFKLLKQKMKINKNLLTEYLQQGLDEGIYLQSKRAFGKKQQESLYSLKIDTISIQLISFILKSIYVHKMEPNHVLVHSRIKEYFGIKIKMKDWKRFVDNLRIDRLMQNQITKVSHLFQGFKIVPNQEGNFLFEPFDYNWEYLDIKPIQDDDPDYQIYLDCMEDFFNKENDDEFQFLTKSPSRWKICLDQQDESKKSLLDLLKEKKIDKAIPGGKYGCSLLLKKIYSKKLRNIKLGKIIRMVKKSLKEQKFIHEKTLIYKNNKKIDLNENEKFKKISNLKKVIIKQLEKAKNNGISLSQLPQIIKDSLGYQPNFEDLGFPKLKQFIETINNVFILKNSENHISIKLRKYTTWQEETFPNQFKIKGKNSYKSKQSKKSLISKNQKKNNSRINKKFCTVNSDFSLNDKDSYNNLSEGNFGTYNQYKLADKKLLKLQESHFNYQPLDTQIEKERNKNFLKYLKIILKESKKPMPIEALKFRMQQNFLKNKLEFNFSDKQFKNQLYQLDGQLIRIQDGAMENEYYSTQQLITLIKNHHKGRKLRKQSMPYSDQNCLDRSNSFKQTNQTSKDQFNLWSGNSTPKHVLAEKKSCNFTYLSDVEKIDKDDSQNSSSQGLQDFSNGEHLVELSSFENKVRKKGPQKTQQVKDRLSYESRGNSFPNFPFKSQQFNYNVKQFI